MHTGMAPARACERIGVWLTCLVLQEDREATAEIFFETFNAPYLYIAVQAVLSLAAASCVQSGTLPALDTISGVAVESGDGVTSIVPVAYGYTIGSAVRTIPIAGKDVTKFIFQALRDRGEKVPADMAMYTAQHVKETYGYADLMRPAAAYHVDSPWLLCGQILRHEKSFCKHFRILVDETIFFLFKIKSFGHFKPIFISLLILLIDLLQITPVIRLSGAKDMSFCVHMVI